MKSNSTTYPSENVDTGLLINTARKFVQKRLKNIQGALIEIQDPLGTWYSGQGDKTDITIVVKNMDFYKQIIFSGSKGAAVAYRDDLWTCTDLTTLLRIMIRNIQLLDGFESGAAKIMNVFNSVVHWTRNNTRHGSKKNIHAHYDLGNDMFKLFLDPTMTYSCGIFPDKNSTLEEASAEKLDRICRKLNIGPEDHVVEIGTGWGSFALHAAGKYGCKVTTTTISKEQHDLALERIQAAGLEDKITLLLSDYRDLTGSFDKLVSIEMIEAVGDDHLGEYFSKCASLVKADGQLLIQAITMPDHRYEDYLKRSDFIQQYIFPGSCVPSLTAMMKYITGHTDLRVENIENIGPHYARTLRLWHDKFMANKEEVMSIGYSNEFVRLWQYYLCYCEAGFKEKYLGTMHLHLSRPEFQVPGIQA
ncbi:MAG: class I SAM-dependent methyltransferase [Gammaproteobacteria bacterium]|nr:class I SAM-dependent methyltransferase [Gammaproteobacteria bacterium]